MVVEVAEVPSAKELVVDSLKSGKWEWIAKLLGRNIPQLISLIHILQKVAMLEGELLALINAEGNGFKKAAILIKWMVQAMMGRNGAEDEHMMKIEALFVAHVLVCAGSEHLNILKDKGD